MLTHKANAQGVFPLASLLATQAQNRTLILTGFSFGYRTMLLNMLCRLQKLGIDNYVIAAFDKESFEYCLRSKLPCFPVDPHFTFESSKVPASFTGNETSVFAYGSEKFKSLTKLKSQQVLRLLKFDFDVIWTDVDVFWKKNPYSELLECAMDHGYDILIQSNAPPEENIPNGLNRINSGFYYVRRSNATMNAFRKIVEHAISSEDSEQPSFYAILCGQKLEHRQGIDGCYNSALSLNTFFLARELYPNGAMATVLKDVTAISEDNVNIVHFNWRTGHRIKIQSFVQKGMWLLDEHDGCPEWVEN
jgi:hypothetical protein